MENCFAFFHWNLYNSKQIPCEFESWPESMGLSANLFEVF